MKPRNLWMAYSDKDYAEQVGLHLRRKGYEVRFQDYMSGFWMTKVTVVNVTSMPSQREIAKIFAPDIIGGHAHYEKVT